MARIIEFHIPAGLKPKIQMIVVSRAARSSQGLTLGTYLRSQAEAAVAQESEAHMRLLQSQLDYATAQDELNEAIGQSANE